jgi:hypothetical protein
MVISSTGFGRRISWSDDTTQTAPHPYTLTFRAALTNAIHNMFIKVLTRAVPLPLSFIPAVEKTERSYNELKSYMMDMIVEGKQKALDDKGGDKEADLFRRLMEANEGVEEGRNKLSADELLSNIYVGLSISYVRSHADTVSQTFLLAGHGEQTAF